MSNRSSSQTASIASFDEKLYSEKTSIWNRPQGYEDPAEPSVNNDPDYSVTSNSGGHQSGPSNDEPEEPKTGTSLFARSMDSLVLAKGELVFSGSAIDIDSTDAVTETGSMTFAPAVATAQDIETDWTDVSSEQSVDLSPQRKFTMTREIRVPPEKVNSTCSSSQSRSSSTSSSINKPHKTSISDVTDRLSRPKKQVVVTTLRPSANVSMVSSASKTPSSVRQDPFVRGSMSRSTLPASVFNANKKKAAELETVPIPPQRTTSIRASAASDRLSKGLPTSSTRRSVEPSQTAAVAGPNTKRSSVSDTNNDSAHDKTEKHQSLFQKIVQKNPIRKAPLHNKEEPSGIQRPSKPGVSRPSRP